MPEPKDVLSDEKLEHLIGKIEGELENLRKGKSGQWSPS